MNILLMIDAIPLSVPLGGASRVTWDTATGLVTQGHTVTILTAAYDGEYIPMEKDGVHIVTIPARKQRWAHYRSVFSQKRAMEVMHVIESVRPDIIHAHVIAWQCGYRWIPLAHQKKIPIIVTCHDVMNVALGKVLPNEKHIWLNDLRRSRWSWNPFRTKIVRRVLQENCTILTVSDTLRTFMESCGFRNLQTLHNGIDLSFWTAGDRAQARQSLGIPEKVTTFLLAGRLGIAKGTEQIVRTLPQAAHLILAGETHLQAFKPIQDRVHFFANQSPEQMRTLYAACDAALVPSSYLDPFPTITLEAMACSRPVLATSWGGAKEAVINEKTGWVMHPLDETSWKMKMEWCEEHKEELAVMGKAARAHMEESFTQKHYLEELVQVYESALL